MIKVKLNDLKYQYDVYQIINQFFDFEEIKFFEEDYDYFIELSESKITCGRKQMDFVYEENKWPDLSMKEQVKLAVFRYFTKLMKVDMPWGTLVGIRPTKKVLSLFEEGKTDSEIIEYFSKHHLARRDKVELCMEVARWERKTVNTKKNSISVYVGMPFCPTRCLYCSFTSNVASSSKKRVEDYIITLVHEMQVMGKYIKDNELDIQCIYFGGGTPTAVNDLQFEFVMKNIYENFYSDSISEFTVECGRPDSISEAKLLSMKRFGVDRISINPQTMNDDTLKAIGRNHSARDVINKFNLARNLGFDNINMDIIVGLPGENINNIKDTVKKIKDLKPDNITVHGLCVKRGSKLHEKMLFNYKLYKLSQNEINDMYECTTSLAKSLSMHPYYMYRQKNMIGSMENIGYALHNKEGIYNIQMIEEKQTIIALGADAVTKVVFLEEDRHERFANTKDVKEYVDRIEEMLEKKIALLDTLYK
ncbi:MAG: coproporphyrinogen III oxidase [Clostridiaceae bacterium]|nr:coproporphyrinogen III oxidase [Clostridiaceae bacterium]